MKALLVTGRWAESRSLLPASGRPFLDLFLISKGLAGLERLELPGDGRFDPNEVPPEYGLLLIQGDGDNRRLRRAVLSRLGLSLGLEAEDSTRLRVQGARPLGNAIYPDAGFVARRRGRLVVYSEAPLWPLRHEWFAALELLGGLPAAHREREAACWMLEGGGKPLDCNALIQGGVYQSCWTQSLPEGDGVLFVPAGVAQEVRRGWQEQLGERFYAQEPMPLEEYVGQRLLEQELTVAVAESCTAGLISGRLSAVPGSSRYLTAGTTVYHNEAKIRLLGVERQLLEQHGAVSIEVARAMAQGMRALADTDLAVAVTGIAGPGGGTEAKPVGTVFLAAVNRQGTWLEYHGSYRGNRDSIRTQAGQTALHLLRRLISSCR